jgi:hypothetical protein
LGLGTGCGGAWSLGLGTWCGGAWSLKLGAGLGARRKSEHRSQSSNAQQAAMSHLTTNPRVRPNAVKNRPGSGTQEGINPSKGGRFLACSYNRPKRDIVQSLRPQPTAQLKALPPGGLTGDCSDTLPATLVAGASEPAPATPARVGGWKVSVQLVKVRP